MPAPARPHSFSAIQAFGFVFSQSEYISFWQAEQTPHAMGKGTTTRSPALSVLTWGPTSTTSPMNSWPRMSPGIMAGTYAWSRCKSEPQIAVEVIFTIASRALMIFGSGTSSTWTVFGPFQHVAFIVISLRCSPEVAACRGGANRAFRVVSDSCGLGDPRWHGCRRLGGVWSRDDAIVGVDDFAQLDQLLEAAQVAADLRAQRLGKDAGDLLAQLAARRVEPRVEDDFGPSPPGGGPETHLARCDQRRPCRGLPGDPLVWSRVGNLDVPVECDAGGSSQAPARVEVARNVNGGKITHEARQIPEALPERVHLSDWSVDRDRRFGVNLAALRHRLGLIRRVGLRREPGTAERIDRGDSGHRGGRRRDAVVVRSR